MNNLSQKSCERLDLVETSNPYTRISARELHKYIVGLVGVFLLFIITYPIAIHRVDRQSRVAKEGAVGDALTAGSK
jgi:hypothetical protein